MKRGWFGPKLFGIGVSPASWQGWLVLVVFLAAMAAPGLEPDSRWAWIVRGAAILVFGLIVWRTYRRDARTVL